MNYKVRVKKMPKTGDQVNYELYHSAEHGYVSEGFKEEPSTRDTLQPVDKEDANVEAEKGEVVVGDFDNDGLDDLMKFGGQRHSNGGTPAKVPDGAFIYSDTRKMKVKGPVLQEFGYSEKTKKSYTPATIASKYDLNSFNDKLKNADDSISLETAALSIASHKEKLAKLALLQESMKGMPDGVPDIAKMLVPEQPQVAKLGGIVKAQNGKTFGIGPTGIWLGDQNKTKDPTSNIYSNTWNAMKNYKSMQDYADKVGYTGKIDLTNTATARESAREIQRFVQGKYPDLVRRMEEKYGEPLGKTLDGFLGARWGDIADNVPPSYSINRNSPTTLNPNSYSSVSAAPPRNPSSDAYQDAQTQDQQIDPVTGKPITAGPSFRDVYGITSAMTRPIDNIRDQLFSPNVIPLKPTYLDNRADIQSMQSAVKTTGNMIQNSANGPVARANMIASQSAILDPINQSNAQTNNSNVQIANSYNQYNNQLFNNNNLQKLSAFAKYKQSQDMSRANLSKEKNLRRIDALQQYDNMQNNIEQKIAFKIQYPNYDWNWDSVFPKVTFTPTDQNFAANNGQSDGMDKQALSAEYRRITGKEPTEEGLKWLWDKKSGYMRRSYDNQNPIPRKTTTVRRTS